MYQSYKTDYSTESDNGIGYFVSLIQNFITEYVRRAGRMKNRKVRNFAEFALWTKTRMLERGISQRELAAGMGTHQARISEAITGKPSGKQESSQEWRGYTSTSAPSGNWHSSGCSGRYRSR